MKKYSLLLLSIVCIAQYSFAQKEAWNWHFGEFAALNFSTGTPVALTNSVLKNDEGVASISDSNGRLLFYTNGLSVYDSTNTQMPNGSGLLGHPSSTQSSVIVKKPNSNSLYYLFTVDYAQGQNGFAYSIIDMSLNNGRGDISTKNVLVRALGREKLTAVRHSNGTDFWILINDWAADDIYAYHLSSTGLNMTPVVSNIGSFHNYNENNTLGYMKANRQNNKIALAMWVKRTFELVDFNNTTGLCSNHIIIQGDIPSCGVEFSPDGTKLYATTHYGQPNKLIQFNLNLPNASAMYNSRTEIATSNNERYFSALQIAPNGKIYCSLYQQQFLDVINNPDSLGFVCNYVDNGVGLSGKSGNFGLPNFVYDYAMPLRICPSITPSVTMPICGSINGTVTVNATGGTTFQYSLDSINFVNSNQFTGLSSGQYTIFVKNEIGCISSKQVNLTCTPPTTCAESKRANVWYFGHGAGLDFNTNPPTVLTDGRINTLEGVASISDSLGRLLFYTDGITVWNKNHQVMSNGTDLLGNPSATQSGIIVPFPNNPNLYYIFTTDAVENGYRNGFRYSIVDIRLNNGLGNVTIKNQLLLPNSTERICAVKHKNNCDIWVIAQDKANNMNVSFLVTSNGIEINRILSPIGINTNDSDYGYIKPSLDGKQIACALSRNSTICLYKFNNSTGVLSDVKVLVSSNFADVYGVEFSPSGNLLYLTLLRGPARVVQINLLSGSINQIVSSMVVLASNNTEHFYGALQTTPYGEIYVTNAYWWGQPPQSSSIGIVRNPNTLGVGCNFQDQAIRFDPVKTSLGFPNFIQSYFTPTKPKISGETTVCASTTKTYQLSAIRSCNTTVQWRVLDNNANIQNPTDTSVSVLLPASGQVRLVATVADVCTSEKDTLTINVGAAITITPSVTMPICGSPNGSITVNATGGTNLQYSLDSVSFKNSNQFTGLSAGQYTVYVQNETGCVSSKQVNLTCTPPTTCSESKRANVWYFGFGAGLDFNTCPPTVLTNGKINTLEGVATISDSSGKLLFYTDGISVWNKNHQLMPNGTGLLGNPSATHSAIIIPLPNNLNIYYIFTTDALENGYQNGFRYSIVDIRLNSGLGDVTTKNQLLIQKATERICAIKHKNNGDIWVIAQDKLNNTNNAYLVTQNGIAGNPIISPVGLNIEQYDYGYFKPSLQGNQIVGAYSHNEAIVICNFDNSTGIISNPTVLTSPNFAKVYGVEFSPDGNLLYTSFLFHNPARLVQFNLKAGSINQIMASMVEIASYNILTTPKISKCYHRRFLTIYSHNIILR